MVAVLITDSADSVEQFMKSLVLPERVAKGVLFCKEDCQEFYGSFYKRNHYVIDDLLDFREYKISKSEITLDLFLELCYTSNMVEVFIKTFYQYFTLEDLIFINEAIASNQTTLENLFLDFRLNPNQNIMKNIL